MKNATEITFGRGLHDLGDGAWAYLQPNGTLGLSNAGLLAGGGSSILVDTLFDLHLAGAMLEAMAPILADNPLTIAVNTHANPDHTFGNQLLPKSTQVWASAAASSEFDDYPPAVMAENQKMRADDSGPFATFDFTNIELRRPDRTFNGLQELSVAGRTVQLMEVGPAHTKGDVIVYAADPGIVIAGDILFAGILPMMWQGPTSNWIAALDRIIELEPNLVIPGHGPVTDVAGVRRARDLLAFVEAEAIRCRSRGMGVMEAVNDIGPEPFRGLLEPERIVNLIDMMYNEGDATHTMMTAAEAHEQMTLVASSWEAS
jgi:cyclase